MAKYSKEYYRRKKSTIYKPGDFDPYEEYYGISKIIKDDWDKRASLMYIDSNCDRGKSLYMRQKDKLDGR